MYLMLDISDKIYSHVTQKYSQTINQAHEHENMQLQQHFFFFQNAENGSTHLFPLINRLYLKPNPLFPLCVPHIRVMVCICTEIMCAHDSASFIISNADAQ